MSTFKTETHILLASSGLRVENRSQGQGGLVTGSTSTKKPLDCECTCGSHPFDPIG